MNTKRITAFLTSLLMLGSMLVSCGSGDTAAAETTAAQGDTAETTTAVETTASEYVNPNVDFEGADFVAAAYSSENVAWQAATYCDAWAEEENGDPINDAVYQRNRAVEETLNVSVVCKPFDINGRSIAGEVVKLILAGEDIIDMAFVTGLGMPTMIGSGDMVHDLNDISTLDLSASWWDEMAVKQLSLLDANYIVTGDISLYSNFAPNVYFFNKQMVSDYGLDDPYQLVRDGKWTLDNMFAMAEAVGRDTNGDGVYTIDDTYGLAVSNGMLIVTINECGLRTTDHDENNVPIITANSEKMASLYEKYITYVHTKPAVTLHSDYTGYSNVFSMVFLPMFAENRALFFNNQLLVAMDLRDMEADFGILPSPKYDEAQEEHITISSNSWQSFVVVPVTNSDLDFTGTVLDCMGYHSQQIVTPAYIDTTITGKAIRDEDSGEMLDIILSNRHYDLVHYYQWGSLYSLPGTMTKNNSTDFASQFAAIEAASQAAIDKTVEMISNG